MDWIW